MVLRGQGTLLEEFFTASDNRGNVVVARMFLPVLNLSYPSNVRRLAPKFLNFFIVA